MKTLLLNLVYDSKVISGFVLEKKKGDSLVQDLVFPRGSVVLHVSM